MSTTDKPSDGEDLSPPNISPDNMPAEEADTRSEQETEQTPSEVAMRINLLGRLVIPPSNP